MAYDETLADRVRDVLAGHPAVSEKRMFGGLAFMLAGNMCCGIVGDELMLRLGPEAEQALAEPHTREMDFTGRPTKGMLYVTPDGLEDRVALADWVDRALAFAESLPPK